MPSVKDQAVALGELGYYPVPLIKNSKRPVHKKWEDALFKGDAIPGEFEGNLNIGVILGRESSPGNYLMAVDVDIEDELLVKRVWIAMGGVQVPAKRGQKGITFFGRVSEQQKKKLFKRKGEDKKLIGQIEILGFGQQTVLPPSIHPDTGDAYTWVTIWGPPIDRTPIEALPELTPWVLDEINLATVKPDASFFQINDMEWMGPGGGGTVHDAILAAIGTMVQRGWPREAVTERCGRAVRHMLAENAYSSKWDWDIFNDVLSKQTEGAFRKGFDKSTGPKKMSRVDMQNQAVDNMIADFGGHDRIGVVDGLFRVYSDGWWQEWTTDSLMRRIIQNPDNWTWMTAADAKAVMQKVAYAAPIKHRQVVDRVMTETGPVDLGSRQIITHNPDDLLTYMVPIKYDPKAKCPKYDAFVRDLLGANNLEPSEVDKAVRLFEEYAGLTFVVDTSFQKSTIILGPPATGKSTLLRLLSALHPPTSQVHLDLFDLRSERTQVSLAGRMVAITPEISSDEFVSADVYKKIVDGSTMSVRHLYAERFDLPMTARIVVAANEMFKYRDSSGAMERRMNILKTKNSMPEAEWDLKLLDKLTTELPGIFNRWINGLARLRKRGRFDAPLYMKEILGSSAEASDVVLRWLHERTHEGMHEVDKEFEVKPHQGELSSTLYADFKSFVEDRGHKAISDVTWGARLTMRGYPVTPKRTPSGVHRIRQLKLVQKGSSF